MRSSIILFSYLVAVALGQYPNNFGGPVQSINICAGQPDDLFCQNQKPTEKADGPIVDGKKHVFCYKAGEPCSKAKRATLDLAERFAEAYVEADTVEKRDTDDNDIADDNLEKRAREAWCFRSGQPCFKMKRVAEAIAEALADPGPEAAPEPEAHLHLEDRSLHAWCSRAGKPCNKLKRATDTISSIIAEPEVTAWPSLEGRAARRACFRPGQACWKHKRALDSLGESLKKI